MVTNFVCLRRGVMIIRMRDQHIARLSYLLYDLCLWISLVQHSTEEAVVL